MDIVSNGKAISGGRTARSLIKNPLEVVLGNLNIRELVVIVRVQIEIGDDITKVLDDSLAGCIAG